MDQQLPRLVRKDQCGGDTAYSSIILVLHWLWLVTVSPSSIGVTDYSTITTGWVVFAFIGRSSSMILSVCQCVFFTIIRSHASMQLLAGLKSNPTYVDAAFCQVGKLAADAVHVSLTLELQMRLIEASSGNLDMMTLLLVTIFSSYITISTML